MTVLTGPMRETRKTCRGFASGSATTFLADPTLRAQLDATGHLFAALLPMITPIRKHRGYWLFRHWGILRSSAERLPDFITVRQSGILSRSDGRAASLFWNWVPGPKGLSSAYLLSLKTAVRAVARLNEAVRTPTALCKRGKLPIRGLCISDPTGHSRNLHDAFIRATKAISVGSGVESSARKLRGPSPSSHTGTAATSREAM